MSRRLGDWRRPGVWRRLGVWNCFESSVTIVTRVSLNQFGLIDHSGHCWTPNQEKGRGGEDNPRQILAQRMSEFVTNMFQYDVTVGITRSEVIDLIRNLYLQYPASYQWSIDCMFLGMNIRRSRTSPQDIVALPLMVFQEVDGLFMDVLGFIGLTHLVQTFRVKLSWFIM